MQSWLDRIAAVGNAQECMDCLDALNTLPSPVTELIWNSALPLHPHFWEMAEIEQANGEPQQTAGIGFGTEPSPQQQANHAPGDASSLRSGVIAMPPSAEKPANCTVAKVKDLIAGLGVRTRDGFYGHLGAMVADGRWWVKSPSSPTTDAQSRLYAATDIIPMPTS